MPCIMGICSIEVFMGSVRTLGGTVMIRLRPDGEIHAETIKIGKMPVIIVRKFEDAFAFAAGHYYVKND